MTAANSPAAYVDNHPARIMVVDDDPMLRTLIQIRLKKLGFFVFEASDGFQAVDLFPRENPDIILMDASMPGMDGFEATNALKTKYPEAVDTPILMVSGLEDDQSVDRAFGAGATEYITKPICWPLLIHRLMNICEAMRVRTNILQAKTDAVEANRSKSEFLANMSHELRTPMHAILSFASMGCENVSTAPTKKLERYFNRIFESGNRLLVLLNDLLDLSKMEAGAIELDCQRYEMADVVRDVVEELDGWIRDRGIKLIIESTDIGTSAYVDRDKIGQVARNLLSNAVKFSDEGGTITIRFESAMLKNATQDKDVKAIAVVVEDQGIGIPEEELESVFDKFVQSSKTKTGAGGTGLGLSICSEIVGIHGGEIFARNNESGGSTFCFKVPVSRPEQRDDVQQHKCIASLNGQ